MREVKFTTGCDPVLYFEDRDFKKKYEERIGNRVGFVRFVGGEEKHLALCPMCNNPVVLFGIYRKIDATPHARHAKGMNIPSVSEFNESNYLKCPYHVKQADYVKEYVPDKEVPDRYLIYKTAKEHFDKAIYLLQKGTGIRFNLKMIESMAMHYAGLRVYNYIDATVYNIPWYLMYSHHGFPLHHLLIRKDSVLHKRLKNLGIPVMESKAKGYVYVEYNHGYVITATNYRYSVDKRDHLREWLDFSIVKPDDKIETDLLFKAVDRFSLKVDSYYFGNLVNYDKWNPDQKILDIAAKYMNP